MRALFFLFLYLCKKITKSTAITKMMRARKTYVLLLFISLIVTLSSCGSSRKAVMVDMDVKGPKELQRKLGIKVKPSDNIFLYSEAASWLGVPHRYGGMTKKGVDCSGFVSIVYEKIYGVKLERSSADMLSKNCKKVKKGSLEEGDLVFFRTGKKRGPVNHSGIYLKDGKFIHTSTSRGVMISSLDEEYYRKTYYSGGKVK